MIAEVEKNGDEIESWEFEANQLNIWKKYLRSFLNSEVPGGELYLFV